ncbi:Tetratricopeptide repeat-containing protein [Vibrio xiamenensis]|uniref:Tetratricopeptide repeat-containing protein n=1 Tax=Vibrio xiamenensis TaxID=861298 RepID=A0A1G8ETV7_9VIBR|nr:cellulose synthase subunit BcsC-related outer membrane protein [Vibrio xiamenensis]SDH73149.1 Tetratricopeptide repeat-containing protein [Vibrio xiamenensis]
MKNNKLKLFSTLCLFEALQFGFVPYAGAESSQDPALQTLLEQAEYWHEKSNDPLANESLKKVLMVDANNPQALYLMALWAQQQGDDKTAAQWQARLQKAHPNAPQLQQLASSSTLSALPQEAIELARQQSQAGEIKASIETWNSIFQGQEPPIPLVPEYYLTMSGDKSLYPTAVEKLAQFAKQNPNNSAIGVAYGQVLTYRENTRRKGIQILKSYASVSPKADQSLRQALIWLEPNSADKALYENWADRHPGDSEVVLHYKRTVGGGITRSGYNQLNSGNLSKAKSEFQTVLAQSPNDSEALAGLGYVALHQGDYTTAAKYLNRAADQGGSQAKKRRNQADEAKFYAELETAKSAYKQGDVKQALALSAPLAERSGQAGVTAKLFRADVLRHNGDYVQAEDLLKRVIKQVPNSLEAKEALYYVYTEQNQKDNAATLLATMPKDLQRKIQSADRYGNMRDLAQQAIDAGNIETAIVILENGLQRLPNNPWLRLELAKLHLKQGDEQAANDVLAPLNSDDASGEALYALALFAGEREQWREVNSLIGRIPVAERTDKIEELYQQSRFYLALELASSYLTGGDKAKALEVLERIKPQASAHPLWAGKLAQLLVKCGDTNGAVTLVKASIAQGIQGNAGDYADQVAVLYKAGLRDDAESLLNDPQLIAASTPLQLARARNVYVINEADSLRNQGNYAPAYDLLTHALQIDPQNTDLMLAMGRLYQSGKLNGKAQVVYDYLLDNQKDTPEQDALIGAINIALADGEPARAAALAQQLKNQQSAPRMLLMARIYEAQGEHGKALATLREARAKLLGLEQNYASTSPMIGGLVIADNPFESGRSSVSEAQTSSVYGVTMPWQVHGDTVTQRLDLPEPSEEQQTLADVNRLMVQINQQTSSWLQGGIEIRGRDGESGLSKLTEARAPLQWSTIPFGDSRFKLNIDAVSLDGGTSSGDANRRFGTGALIQGSVAEAEGLSTLSDDELPDVDSQGAQSQSGVEFGMALEGDYYQVDMGTTPLGLELSTLIGGVTFKLPLGDYAQLSLSGERRAVKDSVLSYVGAYDTFSGKYWGQVTRNGANLQFNFDDGDAGYYANAGLWRYIGHNVAENTGVDVGAGVYLRPYQLRDRQLQIGLNLNYKDFEQNLGYYSYGHGGYFSPQNYVSMSFPVDYQQEFHKLSLELGGSLGYQSYSQDQAAYFPNDASLQSTLESYVTSGYAEEAYYSGESVSGIGYNFHAALGYKIQQDISLEARVGYDTFGDYNEASAQITLRHAFNEF